jgi:putative ABC transport system permease protein
MPAPLERLLGYGAEALDAIWRNRGRSLLTLLGMIIGTAAVIAVLGISRVSSSAIAGSLDSFGDPGVYVSVDPRQDDPVSAAIAFRDVATVRNRDAAFVAYVQPNYQSTYAVDASRVHYVGTVSSATPAQFDRLTLREGRRIDEHDVAAHGHVCLLGRSLEARLFGHGAYAVGRSLRVDGERFEIVGVYDDLAANIFTAVGSSDYIEIPYSTFHDLAPGPVDSLNYFVRPGVAARDANAAVDATLKRLHGAGSRYIFQDALSFLNAFERTIDVVAFGLAGVGGVALVVAGIGIMNIMLVSVSERTREIGIRKSIGGSSRDITLQFLIEAVTLSLAGGLIGLLLGLGVLAVAGKLVVRELGPAPVPWLSVCVLAVVFSTSVGIVFGTYPAVRAGRLDPIEALRS